MNFLLKSTLPLSILLLSILPLNELSAQQEEKEYQGRFWSITGNGVPDSSYLYGTIHIKDSRAYEFPAGTRRALKSVDAYALELNLDSVNRFELMGQLMMDDSITLQDLLSKAEYRDVKKYVNDSLNMKLKPFERMHPMLLMSRIQMKSFKSDSDQALDRYFHMIAKKKGKEVIGLETMSEQVSAFQSIPYDSMAQQLVRIARGKGGNKDEASMKQIMDKMLKSYLKGDLPALMNLTEKKMSGDFEKVFITERNQRMADRAAEHLKERSLFIAVGAAHLPGEKGVIELLRKKGFKVESISGDE